MSRRRQQRRAEKARRQLQPTSPTRTPPQEVVVRQARFVERLAYTRSQAAQALGISRSTFRRLLPYVETIEMPWGGKLIPVDELGRLIAERRRTATAIRRPPAPPGRKPSVPPELVDRMITARAVGKSLNQIAADLNAEGTPTAHGGARWWPSTVRGLIERAGDRTSR